MAKFNIWDAKNVPLADGGTKLSEMISVDRIEEHPEFKELFAIEQDVLERIVQSMKNGYDNSQPVHIWVEKETVDDEVVTHNYLIDGYTRVAAARQAGVAVIPYFRHNFSTFDEAYAYSIKLQVNRRNLDSKDIIKNIELLGGSHSNSEIADSLGISVSTVNRGKNVLKNGSEEQIEKIKTGDATIREVDEEIRKEKKQELKKNNDDENEMEDDIIEDSSSGGSPAPLVFSHTDGIERPDTKLSTEEDSERTSERAGAHYSGLQKGSDLAYEIYDYICRKLDDGADAASIRNDEKFTDFSVEIIYSKFEIET